MHNRTGAKKTRMIALFTAQAGLAPDACVALFAARIECAFYTDVARIDVQLQKHTS
jgi:hypothetical protein